MESIRNCAAAGAHGLHDACTNFRMAEFTVLFFTYVIPHPVAASYMEIFKDDDDALPLPSKVFKLVGDILEGEEISWPSAISNLALNILGLICLVEQIQGGADNGTVRWLRYNFIDVKVIDAPWGNLYKKGFTWKNSCKLVPAIATIAREVLILTCPENCPVVHVARIVTPLVGFAADFLNSKSVKKQLGIIK